MRKVLLATGQIALNKITGSLQGYEISGVVESREDVHEMCDEYSPDILMITDMISGEKTIVETILDISRSFPKIRIIYLAGEVDLKDKNKIQILGTIALSGIYDIIATSTLNIEMIKNILDNPKDRNYVEKYIKEVEKTSLEKNIITVDLGDNFEKKDKDDPFNKVYVVSSIKPGTGKSFLSVNIATAIAKFGKPNEKKERPKVALIEADLQNLSVGTLLGLEDDKRNIKAVMDDISKVVSKNGIKGTSDDVISLDRSIMKSFIPYRNIGNLKALVGSQLTYEEIKEIQSYQYVYLLESIVDNFDVIIIDTNSSIEHITTYSLLQMANACYYIVNLDFNNIRNNIRYKDQLNEMGISPKVRYVLNEDIENTDDFEFVGTNIEKLELTADLVEDRYFKLEGRIPSIPKTVFLNRLYEGVPIVLDENNYTLKARYELCKIANSIWGIEGLDKLEEECLKYSQKNKKKGFFF